MKTGVLFLLLLSLVSNIYSYEVNDNISTTLPTKNLPKTTKALHAYVTKCSTKESFKTIATTIGSSNGNIPAYNLVPATYEHCYKYIERCTGSGSILYPTVVRATNYTRIECPEIDLSNNKDIVAIADLSQKETYYPEGEQINENITESNEYFIQNKTLFCYKKQQTTSTKGGIRNTCTTTLGPVEITRTTKVPVVTTKIPPVTTKIPPVITTTLPSKLPTKKVSTTTTTTTTITTLPSKLPTKKVSTTTTTTTTTFTKTLPKTLPTTTTTTTTAKFPIFINTVEYVTKCSTKETFKTIATKVELSKKSVPVYEIVPAAYEHCVVHISNCRDPLISFYPKVSPAFNYVRINCPEMDITGSEDIVAIADLSQREVYTPQGREITEEEFTESNDYFVYNKTLYCYKRNKTVTTHGGMKTTCSFTLAPVEITRTTKIPPITTKIPPITTKIPPITSKIPPVITTTTTTTTTTKVPSTKTLPTTLCENVTVTVTEKDTVTVKEKVTVTVTENGDSTVTEQPQLNCAPKWGQCGGQNYKGPTCCQSGSTCRKLDKYYSQCV